MKMDEKEKALRWVTPKGSMLENNFCLRLNFLISPQKL